MSDILKQSGIIRVTCYTASPIECCDRCSQGIKYVWLVVYRDGFTAKFGSDCINKILSGDTSLKALFNKNAKLLHRHQLALAALSMPDSEMPKGTEYYNSGLFFIADSEGKDVNIGHWFFHPLYDAEKNESGDHYIVADAQAHAEKCYREIEKGKAHLVKEISRIEGFLARVLSRIAKQAA